MLAISLRKIQQFWAYGLDLLFPPTCAACGKSLETVEEEVCLDCCLALPRPPLETQQETEILLRKFYGRVPITHAFALLDYRKGGRVEALIYALKYGHRPGLGRFLGRWLGQEVKASGWSQAWDAIVPVPIHASKFYERGYNQAEQLALGLSTATGIPMEGRILYKQRKTLSQSRSRLNKWQRALNVQGAFALRQPEAWAGKRILLVDDVLTTGATLEQCALVFQEAGAQSVGIAALATKLSEG